MACNNCKDCHCGNENIPEIKGGRNSRPSEPKPVGSPSIQKVKEPEDKKIQVLINGDEYEGRLIGSCEGNETTLIISGAVFYLTCVRKIKKNSMWANYFKEHIK